MNKTGTAAGGHFYVKEPGSALTHFIGLLLLFGLMIIVTFSDISRMIAGG